MPQPALVRAPPGAGSVGGSVLGSSSGRVVGSVSGVVASGGVGMSSSSSDVVSPGGAGSSSGSGGSEVGGVGGVELGGVLVSLWGGALDVVPVVAGVVALGSEGVLVGVGSVVGAALRVAPGVALVVWGAVTELCAASPSSAASLQPSAPANTVQDATKR